ncbi:MAG: DUF4271 domain-containing protein [Muribaculaceae bacterium]|nr:DUF4271 domain-containing protein [Muribaculaceae bacterium]MBQ4005147.1 DUF4271 domain-containing protein [Muribaculaceae bacterium]
MPATTPVPSTPAAVDTAHAVVDSAQLIISPHYVTDFGHGVTTPLPSRDQWEEATVMEVPAGAAPTPVPPSPLRSPVVMGLMMLVAMAVVLSYRTGYKYLENFVRNMFSTRRRENLFDDHTVNETKILTALIGLSCVMQGFALMVGVSLAVPSLASGILRSPALSLGLGAAVVLVYYLLQLLVYHVLGYVFTDSISTRLWIDGFKATQSLLGLLLLPVIGVMLLKPELSTPMLLVAAGLYICARLVFICKGFRIFYGNLSSIVYFILYLCSLEIVPLAMLGAGTIYLCRNVLY